MTSAIFDKISLFCPYSLLPNDEPEAGETMEKVFHKEGITRVIGRLKSVISDGSSGNGKHVATCLSTDGSEQQVTGDIMLVAVGRAPIVKGMGLEEIGIKINKDGLGIAVDDKLKTSVKGIYAAGDCTGVQQLYVTKNILLSNFLVWKITLLFLFLIFLPQLVHIMPAIKVQLLREIYYYH